MSIWSHEDPVPGIFNDGAFPVDREVTVRQAMGELIIADRATKDVLARWPLGTLRPVPDADFPNTMRLKQAAGGGGRLAIRDRDFNEGLAEWWPGLRRGLVSDAATLHTALRVSLAAIVGLGLFFLALLPVLGQLGANLVPPGVERRAAGIFLRRGDPLLERINVARECETESVTPILDKLMDPLRAASGWPQPVRIRVIDDPLPNAATVPGGEIVLFRGLLFFAHSGDELAGILAHEMGHVTRRHSLRNFFVTSLNFFGFDQLLGNFSAQLVVHPVSGVMLTRREGRRAEYEADRSAIEILNKAGLKIRPLADLLDRVGYLQGEKEVAEGWLATHPLSRTRARMIRDAAPHEPPDEVLTMAEFSQLRAVCTTKLPEQTVILSPSGADDAAGTDAGTGGEGAPAEDTPEEGETRPEPEERAAESDTGVKETGASNAGEPDADAARKPQPETPDRQADKADDADAPELDGWDPGGN